MSFEHHQHCCVWDQGCWDLGTASVVWVTGTRQGLCIVCLFQPNVGATAALPLRGKKRMDRASHNLPKSCIPSEALKGTLGVLVSPLNGRPGASLCDGCSRHFVLKTELEGDEGWVWVRDPKADRK